MASSSLSKPLSVLAGYFTMPLGTLTRYRLKDLPHDLLAGLTVSVVDLPQSMAFAVIAGVSPIYGIYTAIIQALLGGLFTSSAFLSNGTTNTQSLLVAAIVSRLADPGADPGLYLQLVIGLTLLKGIMQLAFSFARTGKLVRYVSASVMVGFTAGAGMLIIVGQIPHFLGLSISHGGDHLPGLPGAIQRVWPHLGQVNPVAIGLGLGTLGVVMIARRISRFIPGPLVVVVAAAALVWAMGWNAGEDAVRIVGPLPAGFASLPHFVMPTLSASQAEALLGGALAMALLGMLESVAIAKSISLRTGVRIDADQEFFGQGLSNLVGAFFQCMPGSGSFSRSALQSDVGARTRLSSVFCALCNAVIIVLLAVPARFIPYASLAAILFIVGARLIDWGRMRLILRASRADAAVCFITFASALLIPLMYAIYVGIFLNIAMYLHKASRLHMHEMVPTEAGPFTEQPINDRAGQRRVVMLQVEGDLFFALADEFQDRLTDVRRSSVRVVVLRLKRTHSIDATLLGVLDQFVADMHREDKYVILCGLKPDLFGKLQAYGLVHRIGEPNVFQASYGVFTSAKQALRRARELVGRSIDIAGIEARDEMEGWAYQI